MFHQLYNYNFLMFRNDLIHHRFSLPTIIESELLMYAGCSILKYCFGSKSSQPVLAKLLVSINSLEPIFTIDLKNQILSSPVLPVWSWTNSTFLKAIKFINPLKIESLQFYIIDTRNNYSIFPRFNVCFFKIQIISILTLYLIEQYYQISLEPLHRRFLK